MAQLKAMRKARSGASFKYISFCSPEDPQTRAVVVEWHFAICLSSDLLKSYTASAGRPQGPWGVIRSKEVKSLRRIKTINTILI